MLKYLSLILCNLIYLAGNCQLGVNNFMVSGHIRHSNPSYVKIIFQKYPNGPNLADSIQVDASGHFEKSFFLRTDCDVSIANYNQPYIILFAKVNDTLNIEWDKSDCKVTGRTAIINNFRIGFAKAFEQKEDRAIAPAPLPLTFDSFIKNIDSINNLQFDYLANHSQAMESATYQQIAFDIFYKNVLSIILSPQFNNFSFSDQVKASFFPFIALKDHEYFALHKAAIDLNANNIGNFKTKEDSLSFFKMIDRVIKINRNSNLFPINPRAFAISSAYRNYLYAFILDLQTNTYIRRIGQNIKKFENYAPWLETIIMDKTIIQWLLVQNIMSEVEQYGTKMLPGTLAKQTALLTDSLDILDINSYYNTLQHLQPSSVAADFKLKDIKGEKHSLSQYKGKFVYIDFWSDYCGPCIYEITNYSKQRALDFKNKGVIFLYISLDDSEQAFKTAVTKYKPAGVTLWAKGGIASSVAKQFFITAVPHTIIINPDGTIKDANAPLLSQLTDDSFFLK